MTTDRIKFAYLTYSDMLLKIESGEINEYDICFSKDRLLTYLITETLEPLEIRSRVYVFNSTTEAEEALNKATDTYIGQVVAILDNDKYRGYIVNQKSDKFVVTPLWEHPEPIDYDTLGNRPIINLVGTPDSPITVSDLNDGVYKIKGQYKISNLEETVYLSASDVIITVIKNKNGVAIKRITSDDITDYTITDSEISKKIYVTDEYLKDNNYTTVSYVDIKIEALKTSIKEDLKTYVQSVINDLFNDALDERIDARIGEHIQPTSNDKINNLF